MYLTFHSYKKSETARDIMSKMERPVVEMDWTMSFEDYLCFFFFGMVIGADAVLIYFVR